MRILKWLKRSSSSAPLILLKFLIKMPLHIAFNQTYLILLTINKNNIK
jgi:hypothetical protein